MQVIHKPKPKPELMMQTELLAYVHELESENARLEKAFQKATGVIAATDCVECKKDVEPVKHGRWIRTSENVSTIISPVQHCSECGHTTNYDFPYCSNCGAKMDGGENE